MGRGEARALVELAESVSVSSSPCVVKGEDDLVWPCETSPRERLRDMIVLFFRVLGGAVVSSSLGTASGLVSAASRALPCYGNRRRIVPLPPFWLLSFARDQAASLTLTVSMRESVTAECGRFLGSDGRFLRGDAMLNGSDDSPEDVDASSSHVMLYVPLCEVTV